MIWLCLLLQIVVLCGIKLTLKYWVHPIVILAILWTFLTTSTIIFAPEYDFSVGAYLAIILFQTTAFAGAALGFVISPPYYRPRNQFNFPHIRAIAWSALFVGLAGVLVILRSKGGNLTVLLNPSELFSISREFSLARYEDDYRMPLLARAAQMYVFFAILVCGAQFSLHKKSMSLYEFFIPMVPLALIATILTTRATIVFGLLFWGSAYLSAEFFSQRKPTWQPFSAKATIVFLLSLLAFVALFVWLQFLRGGITGDWSRLPEVLSHLKKWPFGSLAGFSSWYESSSFSKTPTFGYYTLTGLFDLLGLQERETGLFVDYVDLGDGSFGNIYTIFRGLIDDFTFIGALLFMLILGAISSAAISLSRKGSAIGLSGLAVIYPIILFSPVVSFYSFLGHIAAAIAFIAYTMSFRKPINLK